MSLSGAGVGVVAEKSRRVSTRHGNSLSPFRSLITAFLSVAVWSFAFSVSFQVASASAQEPIKVEWSDGRLSVIAERASLPQILQEVARKTGMEVRGLDQLKTEEVFVSFSGVPLGEALRNLLAGVDYGMIGDPSHPGGGQRALLMVLGHRATPPEKVKALKGGVAEAEAVAPEDPAEIEDDSAAGDPTKRRAAVRVAAARRNLRGLRNAAVDPDQGMQVMAFEALTRLDRREALGALLEAVKSDQPMVRVQTLQWMEQSGQVDQATVLSTLREALRDPDPMVKQYAIQALGRNGGPEALGYLLQTFDSGGPSVRLMVLESMARRLDGLPLLQRAALDPDETVRSFASFWLEKILSRSR